MPCPAGGALLSDACTGPLLLAAEGGTLHELALDERLVGKKEPAPKQLWEAQVRCAWPRALLYTAMPCCFHSSMR